jgi:hypothetical protein
LHCRAGRYRRSRVFEAKLLLRVVSGGEWPPDIWQKSGMGPPSAPGKVLIAMAGSLDAVAGRLRCAARSLSPSCSWLSGFALKP